MARRDVNPPMAPRPGSGKPRSNLPARDREVEESDEGLSVLGEWLRRTALGLVSLLFVARAYFESEGAEQGEGLIWVFAVLAVAAVAVASYLLSGTTRLRWSWADAAILTLMVMVGLSTAVAADRRAAINLAWEWGALGLLYSMVRNLPRTRAESETLAGIAVATAVSVAVYGLYQVPVEFPRLRALFESNPGLILGPLGIAPNTPAAEGIKQRILYSREPFSTFALANSLAGFLVGPLALCAAVALENLRREGKGSRAGAFAMAAIPALALLACLLLTKSRSAYLGLLVAVVVLAWRSRQLFPARTLLITCLGLEFLVGGLTLAGVATGQLDRQILTESTKSFRYRWEYWVGTWGIITDARSPFAIGSLGPTLPGSEDVTPTRRSRTFWTGVGPGNFGEAYLAHKAPEASEEIKDPHNLFLDVWASSGFIAALSLVLGIGIALRDTLGPSRMTETANKAIAPTLDPAPPPLHTGWLVGLASLGWLAVVALGKLNPFQGDLLGRWLVLGGSWAIAVAVGSPLWRRRPIPAAGLGVATLAMTVNLLAAGGIGIPTVAMMFWLMIALGLNLRDDRPCGRLRVAGGLGPAVVLACVWAALAGTFFGAIVPFWKSEAEQASGDTMMSIRPPRFEEAREAYRRAIEADHYNVRPWLSLADLEFRFWRSPEAANRKEPYWERVLFAHDGALDAKWRNPHNLDVRRRQAAYAREILSALPPDATPMQLLQLKGTIVKAMRQAVAIYPTSAALRVELARASADLGMYADAVREAKLARELDTLMPHLDKKLPKATIDYMGAQIPRWEAQAEAPPVVPLLLVRVDSMWMHVVVPMRGGFEFEG